MNIADKTDEELVEILTLSEDYRTASVQAAEAEFQRRGLRKKPFRPLAESLIMPRISALAKGYSPFKASPEPPASRFFSAKVLRQMLGKELKKARNKRKDFDSGANPALLP